MSTNTGLIGYGASRTQKLENALQCLLNLFEDGYLAATAQGDYVQEAVDRSYEVLESGEEDYGDEPE